MAGAAEDPTELWLPGLKVDGATDGCHAAVMGCIPLGKW